METFYLFLSLCVLQVHSMALTGPVLTRYRPCELGVIHFDKITDLLWRGEIDLEYYRELVDVEIEIGFEKQMLLHGVSHNSTVVIKNKSHDFIFKPKKFHKNYFIFISTNRNTTQKVPTVSKFRLNEMELCNDYVKVYMITTGNDGLACSPRDGWETHKECTNSQTTANICTAKTKAYHVQASQSMDSLNVTKPNDRDYRHYCGRRALDHGELTSMRTDSKSGDWPWHVAILIRTPNTNLANYQCGGNIISSTAILTAGHCMFLEGKLVETERFIIEAGISNLRNMNESGKQMLFAERVILHPGYSTEHATSDLAIVLVNKLRYSEYVQPICIWGPVYDKTALFGKRAVVTGFGTTEQNVLSDTLRSTDTLIQNDTTCIAHVPKLYSKLLNEFTFCAGFGPGSDINPRNGDSGGGLVIPTMQPDHKVSWFLRGILSKCGKLPSEKFCDPKLYVVYTDVAPHYGWIYHHAGLRYINNIVS